MTPVVSGQFLHIENFYILRMYSAVPWLNATAKSLKNAIAQVRESWAKH